MRTITSVLLAVCCILSANVFAQTIEFIGEFDLPGSRRCNDVFVRGNNAYLAYYGLKILDISTPSNPVLIGSCGTGGTAIYVEGNYAYMTASGYGLNIYDISDPNDPFLIGNCDTPSSAGNLTVVNNHAYIADGYHSGLQIIDISDPENPFWAGDYYMNDSRDISVKDNYAFITGSQLWGLLVLDISIPTRPVFAGSTHVDGNNYGITVTGNYAFITCTSGELKIFNISDPANPFFINQVDSLDEPRDVFISGDYAYVADFRNGLQLIDISDLISPIILDSYDTDNMALKVFVYNDFIYVADRCSGLKILRLMGPGSGAISGVVTDTETSLLITDVNIQIEPGFNTVTTDENGWYIINDIITFMYNISFSHYDYYDTVLIGVIVEDNDTTIVDIAMLPRQESDVGVTAILSPPDTVRYNVPYQLAVEVYNYGTVSQSFEVIYEVHILDSPEIEIIDITTIDLLPRNCYDTAFFETPLYPENETDYDLITYTTLPDDINNMNDTCYATTYFSRRYELIIFYGNIDNSPITVTLDNNFDVDVYAQTPEELYIGDMHLCLGADDQYIDSLLSETENNFYYPLTEWGIAEFTEPYGSPPNPEGWSSQSFYGISRYLDPNAPWLHYEEPTLIMKFICHSVNDSSLIGNTLTAIGPGLNPYQGGSNAGDTCSGAFVFEYFSPVYFLPPDYCNYTPGDINGDDVVIGSDVTYGVNYFRGVGNPPPDSCYNNLTESWHYVAGDANGDCSFIGSDITYLVAYFRGINPPPQWCPQTPPIDE